MNATTTTGETVTRKLEWSDALEEWVTIIVPAGPAETPARQPGLYAIKCGRMFAKLVGVGSAALLTSVEHDATAFDSEDAVLEVFDDVVAHIKGRVLNYTTAKTAKFDIVEL